MDVPQITSRDDAETGGHAYLATGKHVALRRWEDPVGKQGQPHSREYETVGYVLSGVVELNLDGETAKLVAGDSWLVPAGSTHRYRILEDVIAIEATSPPARFSNRDSCQTKVHLAS